MNLPNLSGRVAIDTETKDPDLIKLGPGDVRPGGFIAGVSVAIEDPDHPGQSAWSGYFPMRHEDGRANIDPEPFFQWLKRELANPQLEVVGTNLSYDMGWLATEGVTIAGRPLDVQLAEPLIDENAFSYALDALGRKYLGHGKPEDELYEYLARNFKGKATRKSQGKNIWRAPGDVVTPYAIGDVEMPLEILRLQEDILRRDGLEAVWDLEMRLIKPLVAMRRRGVRVDIEKAEELSFNLRRKERAALDRLGVDTVWGDLSPQYEAAGIEYPRTAKGNPSFTAGWLKKMADAGCRLSSDVLDVRQAEKARGTFVDGYVLGHHVNGRVHAQFNQLRGDEYGTVTGRFCVAGETLIDTDRGRIRIDQFNPDGETRVLSHTGRWNWVKRRIYKGREKMVSVSFSNGSSVQCTRNHRFLTARGWSSAGQLSIGTEVCHVSEKELGQQHEISGAGTSSIQGRGQAYNATTSRSYGRPCSQCPARDKALHGPERSAAREGATVLAFQDWGQKPNDQCQRGRPPQLQGADVRTKWICQCSQTGLDDIPQEPEQGPRASGGGLRTVRDDRNSRRRARTSHQRGAVGQQPEQSSSCDHCGARATPRAVTVTAVDPMGTASVWDIEVERDHSYLAHGVFHHNSSSNPNLQNIPARDPEMAPLVRGLFLPDEGEEWVSHDWSQIEYRLATHYGTGPSADTARQRYVDDPTTDFHQMTAELVGMDRKPAKNINFGLVYGMGKAKLANDIGVTREEAEEIFAIYHARQPFIRAIAQKASRLAGRRGWVKTLLGRRRRFDMWEPRDWDLSRKVRAASDPQEMVETVAEWIEEYDLDVKAGDQPDLPKRPRPGIRRAYTHKALNAVIQGSAADLMKLAMVRIFEDESITDVLGPPLLTVHDELGWSRPRTRAGNEAIAAARAHMIDVFNLKIPLMVDEERGPDWGHVVEVSK